MASGYAQYMYFILPEISCLSLVIPIQKLAVGALPEKIVTSYHSVHDQNVDEEAAFNKFKSVIFRGGEIERNVEEMSAHGILYFFLYLYLKLVLKKQIGFAF